jgi:hypothetical protein
MALGMGIGSCSCLCGMTIARYDPSNGERLWVRSRGRDHTDYTCTVDKINDVIATQGTFLPSSPREEVMLYDGIDAPSLRWRSQNSVLMGYSGQTNNISPWNGSSPVVSGDAVSVWACGPNATLRFDIENGAQLAQQIPIVNNTRIFPLVRDPEIIARSNAGQLQKLNPDGTVAVTYPHGAGDTIKVAGTVYTSTGVPSGLHSIDEDLVQTGFVATASANGIIGHRGASQWATSEAGTPTQVILRDSGFNETWRVGLPVSGPGSIQVARVRQCIGSDGVYLITGSSLTGTQRLEKRDINTGALLWAVSGASSFGGPGYVLGFAVNANDVAVMLRRSPTLSPDGPWLPTQVVRINPANGSAIWTRYWATHRIGSTVPDPHFVFIDTDDEIYVTGSFSDTGADSL